MALRIHFTADDLAKTTIGAPLGQLGETVMALSLLRCPLQRSVFTEWRGWAAGQVSSRMKPLLTLIPPGSRGVDLCTLTDNPATIGQGIGALLALPREHLLAEIEDLDRRHRLAASAWLAAGAGGEARLRLANAADAAFHTLVGPYWPRIDAHLWADHVSRGQIMMHGGVGQLLATLHVPSIRWRPPVLEVLFPGDADRHLGGSGLELVPSLFVGDIPALLIDLNDKRTAPRLIFPAARRPAAGIDPWRVPQPGGDPLAALVGRTRAAALQSIAQGCTTTELAGRTGVSIAAASQHATILRKAGLITTHRNGSAVLHTVTPLGRALLGSARGEAARADTSDPNPALRLRTH